MNQQLNKTTKIQQPGENYRFHLVTAALLIILMSCAGGKTDERTQQGSNHESDSQTDLTVNSIAVKPGPVSGPAAPHQPSPPVSVKPGPIMTTKFIPPSSICKRKDTPFFPQECTKMCEACDSLKVDLRNNGFGNFFDLLNGVWEHSEKFANLPGLACTMNVFKGSMKILMAKEDCIKNGTSCTVGASDVMTALCTVANCLQGIPAFKAAAITVAASCNLGDYGANAVTCLATQKSCSDLWTGTLPSSGGKYASTNACDAHGNPRSGADIQADCTKNICGGLSGQAAFDCINYCTDNTMLNSLSCTPKPFVACDSPSATVSNTICVSVTGCSYLTSQNQNGKCAGDAGCLPPTPNNQNYYRALESDPYCKCISSNTGSGNCASLTKPNFPWEH